MPCPDFRTHTSRVSLPHRTPNSPTRMHWCLTGYNTMPTAQIWCDRWKRDFRSSSGNRLKPFRTRYINPVANLEPRVHMTKRKKIAIAVALVTIGVGVAAANEFTKLRDFGPFYCGSCMLEPVMPGRSTEAFLRDFRDKMRVGGNRLFVGDRITVCSRGFCSTYTITDSEDFRGSGTNGNQSPISTGAAPGRGGSSGHPWFGAGQTGFGAGQTGTVTTGTVTPIPMVPCKFGGAIRMVPAGGCDF